MMRRSDEHSSLKWQKNVIQLLVVMTYIGLALPYAIFPEIFVKGHNTEHIYLYSLLLAGYPLGQSIGMPIVGHLSDLIGRKKILLYTLIGATVLFLISGICIHSHWYILLVIVRFFSGMFESNSAVALAMINDITNSSSNKLKYFGKINVALTLGYLIGLMLGSFFSNSRISIHFNNSLPFFVSALIYFLTFMAVKHTLVETNTRQKKDVSNLQIFDVLKLPIANTYRYLSESKLNSAVLFSLFVSTSADILYLFIPVYLVAQWSASSTILAFGVCILSVGKVIGGGYLVNFMYLRSKSEVKYILPTLLLFFSFVFFLIFSSTQLEFLSILAGLGACIAILITSSISIVSHCAGINRQGSVLGTVQSLRAFSSVVVSNIATISCLISFKIPFMISLFSLLSSLPFLWHISKNYAGSNKKYDTNFGEVVDL